MLWLSVAEEGRTVNRDDIEGYLLSDQFRDNSSVCFVAYVKGCAVGIIIGKWHREVHEPYYEVGSLYVTPSARGGRVAHRLIEAAVDWAGEEDATIFVTTDGPPRGFYKSLGFIPINQVSVSTLHQVRDKLR